MAFHQIAPIDALEFGAMKAYKVEDEHVLLIRTEQGFFATQSKCPHLFMPLEKGKLIDNCRIQCKFHRAEFDVQTGDVCQWANFPPGIQALNFVRGEKGLKTYRTKIEEGMVYVDV
jgi:3-phenylpropionate/trans-cinnamate dioxygenase ferredoxin subunit